METVKPDIRETVASSEQDGTPALIVRDLRKTLKSDRQRCGTTLNISLQLVRSLAILMQPIIPSSSARIMGQLNIGAEATLTWDSAGEQLVLEGHRIGKPEILFEKIEDEMIDRELQSLGSVPATDVQASVAGKDESPARITIDDFRKVDLRTARILECERVEKSKKLLRLQVLLDNERRQVLAGIAEHYAPESLIGKNVVIVANLEPAKLMGFESQGMLLAATDGKGKLVIVSPGEDVEPGTVVR